MTSKQPFKGLKPFYEEDAEYFCGRDEDVEAVMNMLMVHRLTILHGVAGVGKTSFLWAGVAHAMNQEAEQNQKRWGSPGVGIVVFPQSENPRAWLDDPLGNLACSTRKQMLDLGMDAPPFHQGQSFRDFLKDIAARLDNPHGIGQLYLVLDQFEGCLHQEDAGVEKDEFLRSFAKVINTPEVPVHFLVALQSNDLGKLRQLEGLIRRLWDHRYELKHLDKKAATQAILEPIRRFNAQRPNHEAVALEEEESFVGCDLRLMSSVNDVNSIPTEGKNLIIVANVQDVLHFRAFAADGKTVLDTDESQLPDKAPQIAKLKSLLSGLWGVPELPQSDKARVISAVTSIVGHIRFVLRLLEDIRAESHDYGGPSSEWKIEAGYLQLVMQRLWEKEEIPKKSLILHIDTFQSLGGAKGIIQEYVDRCMAKLLRSQREAIAPRAPYAPHLPTARADFRVGGPCQR